jgi:hypothetical protein
MRLARPAEVPATCAVSGAVFVVGWFYLGRAASWRYELVILGAWGLLYLGEWAWRSATGRRAGPSVERDPQP